MTFRIIAEAQAQLEWGEAVDWYETRQRGVGLRFDEALRNFLQTLYRNPQRFPLYTRLTHKARAPKPWSYTVYFTVSVAHREVKVVAIWHHARNPDVLRRRLR